MNGFEMNIHTRLAEIDDLDAIDAVLTGARQFLGAQGLPQWQNGYGPTRAMAEADIKKREGYVLTSNNIPCGYAALVEGVDDVYTHITGGTWETVAMAYLSIHRFAIATDMRGRGLSGLFMRGLVQNAAGMGYRDIRIDTYHLNHIMQRVILRAGFIYRGMVTFPIPDGERMAYQLIIPGEGEWHNA